MLTSGLAARSLSRESAGDGEYLLLRFVFIFAFSPY
jgi:hypothetical protein